ncbi:hypothetical protein SMICM17S_00422 [Streptomyces microflavus]
MPLAPCTSRETSGTVEAAPGWKRALAVPATTSSEYSCQRWSMPWMNRRASRTWATRLARSAMIIIRRAVNRSASTPPNSTRPANGATRKAIE